MHAIQTRIATILEDMIVAMRRFVIGIAMLAGCGGPALQNVPAPDKAIAAGLAAGVAGAATLAQDAAGTPTPEKKKPEGSQKPMKVKERVPAGALDRLDEKKASGEPATDDTTTAPADTELEALDTHLPAPRK
jgi:hypothetical protein